MAGRTILPAAIFAVLASFLPLPASADVALIADLDSNVANGPDTLLIEPTDTVLVHVWITGDGDSLVGFGITLGDTTGALVWVEESPSEVYTMPVEWSTFNVQRDPLGRLLIQAQDFTHSVPLVLPGQVDEPKFTVAAGESCGTIGWDPEMSGWQDWEFEEGVFAGFEGATVCLGGAGDGGGEEDSPPSEDRPTYQLVEVSGLTEQELLALEGRFWVDVLSYEEESSVRMVISERNAAILVEEGYDLTVLDDDYGDEYFDAEENGLPAGYRTYDEIVAYLDEMHGEYPEITAPKDSIGASWEGRAIWAMKVGTEGKPSVLYDALHHANEAMTVNVVLDYLRHLLENHDTDLEAKFLIDEREIWFVPIVNPDGYVYVAEAQDPLWRRNRRDNDTTCVDSLPSFGVDLNRNYGFQWGGGSNDPCNLAYQGPAPFSEPETRAMRGFILDKRIVASDSYHSDIRTLLYPWSYSAVAPEDSGTFTTVAGERTQWNNYRSWQAGSKLLTNVSGSSIDWAHSDTAGVFAFATEVGGTSKWPDAAEIPYLLSEQLSSSIVLSLVAGPYVTAAAVEVRGGDEDGQLDAGETDTLIVTLANWALSASATSVSATLRTDDPYVHLESALSTYGAIPAQASADNATGPFVLAVDPETPAGHRAIFTVRSEWDAGYPHEETITLTVGDPAVIDSLSDDFEEGSGHWEVSGDATSGAWEIGIPARGSFQPGGDASPYPGTSAWVTDEAIGLAHNVNEGSTTLRSPTWDLSAFSAVTLRLNYFFGQQKPEDDAGDFFRIDLSNDDGSTFPECLLFIGDVGHNAVWLNLEVRLDEVLPLTSEMRLRLQASDGSSSDDMIEAGIDDLMLIDRGTGNYPPGRPGLVSPPTGSLVGDEPVLTVSNASDPDGDTLTYHFRVYSDSLLTTLVRSATGVVEGSGETSWTVSPSLPDGTYWWRAHAEDGEERGLFMGAVSFVVTATGVASGESLPQLTVFPARPNPAPSATTIHLLIPRPGRVEADVFDVSGRRVRVLSRGLMEGGAQTLSWDGRDQRGNPAGSGVYFVRVRNEGNERTLKTVLVR